MTSASPRSGVEGIAGIEDTDDGPLLAPHLQSRSDSVRGHARKLTSHPGLQFAAGGEILTLGPEVPDTRNPSDFNIGICAAIRERGGNHDLR